MKAHSEGNVTIRQVASLTDLSPGTAYDLVEALYSILDLGDDESSPTTYPQQTGENFTCDAHSEARQDSSVTEEPAPEDWIESTDDTDRLTTRDDPTERRKLIHLPDTWEELVNVSWRSQLNRGLLDIVAPLSKYVGDLV
ncbi:hypothetical protein PM038_18425 [Halorubrum ezzemoulense]|nr:hypothetical protein [Halorubrum ezzemoulense]MDB2287187.1 hypothetical protein [Halorubrum ezzemoulense]